MEVVTVICRWPPTNIFYYLSEIPWTDEGRVHVGAEMEAARDSQGEGALLKRIMKPLSVNVTNVALQVMVTVSNKTM